MDIEKLKDELRRDEGLRLTPYRCTAGHFTIGYGHNLSARGYDFETIAAMSISGEQAEEWLEKDIAGAQQLVNDWIGFFGVFSELTDARQRVVVNMAFNLGSRLWQFKRLKACIMARDWDGAAREMLDSRWARQVGDRAMRLAEMMCSP